MPPIVVGWLVAQAAPANASDQSVLVIILAVIGAGSGISAAVVAWRNSKSTASLASQGWVDQNLKAQQARIDAQESELEMLRERDVAQRDRLREVEDDNRELHADNRDLHAKLEAVRRECDECLQRVEQLENQP